MLCSGFTHFVETSPRQQDTAEERGSGEKEDTGRDEEREIEKRGGGRRREDMEERERESQAGS